MTLSIIIPYYNAKKYTDELLAVLDRQITDLEEVEVILVDDASPEPYEADYEWLKIIRHRKNKLCSGSRNTGLTRSKGEYITFIDADDMVPEYYVRRLLEEISKGGFDVCEMSWKSLSGTSFDVRLTGINQLPNPAVWCRCFSRTFIGKHRFNTNKDSTEDEDFTRHLLIPAKDIKKTYIPESMYFYRQGEGKFQRFRRGLMRMRRIVYYYPVVTADMVDLMEEIKAEDIKNEVWLLTGRCDIPEMALYAQISTPRKIWAHEARGEHLDTIEIIKPPIRTQVVVYCEFTNIVGGINTFVYAFCQNMKDHYDIVVVYNEMDLIQIARLRKIVRVEHKRSDLAIICDTLILNRFMDDPPKGITYRKKVFVCHSCYQKNFRIPKDVDVLVNVSQSAKDTWGEESAEGIVINNMPYVDSDPCLILVSATRIGATDKGSNDVRMRKLAGMLEAAGIRFLWFCFGDRNLDNMPYGFINMPVTLNTQPYIARADYLVQLSDHEAFSYTVLEALTNGTPVITTPYESVAELGVVDGRTGYIVPFDMDFDVTKLLKIPEFYFEFDTKMRVRQWREILGNTKPTGDYKYRPMVMVKKTYWDIDMKKTLEEGAIVEMKEARIEKLEGMELVERC